MILLASLRTGLIAGVTCSFGYEAGRAVFFSRDAQIGGAAATVLQGARRR
jgi:hypothetical protein